MIVTTTSNLDGYRIIEYRGMVNANIVIGTSFFSDFSASVTDVFGGQSQTYMNHMNNLHNNLIQQLISKATLKKADAIIAVKIDFDQISGKGSQMFMANAQATCVKIIEECYYDEYMKVIRDTNCKEEQDKRDRYLRIATKKGKRLHNQHIEKINWKKEEDSRWESE